MYFKAKSDYKVMLSFFEEVKKLWKFENEASKKVTSYYALPEEYKRLIVAEACKIEGYQETRMKVSRGVSKATYLADINRVPIHMKSYPPPAVGGVVIHINLFESILEDNSYCGIERQTIIDALNRTIGACDDRIKKELFNMVNPLYWLKSILVLILRIPFILLSMTGFNIGKIEDNLFAKLFKVIEVIAIIYILLKLGVNSDQLKEVIPNILK